MNGSRKSPSSSRLGSSGTWWTGTFSCDCWKTCSTTRSSTRHRAGRSKSKRALPMATSSVASETKGRAFRRRIGSEYSKSTSSSRTTPSHWRAPAEGWVWSFAGWPRRPTAAGSGSRTTSLGAPRLDCGCGRPVDPLFQLFQRARPIVLEQLGQGTIREQLSTGLASRAVVGFVLGVHNPLNRRAANRAGLSEFAVHRHFLSKCGDMLGKFVAGLLAQSLCPLEQRLPTSLLEANLLLLAELKGELDRREFRPMKHLARIGIAHAAEQAGIGQSALEGVVFPGERGPKALQVRVDHFKSAAVEAIDQASAAHQVERGSFLRAGLGEQQRAVGEIETRQPTAPGDFPALCKPMQPTGDHQMKNQEQISLQLEDDPLSEARNAKNALALGVSQWGLRRAQDERAGKANFLQSLPDQPASQVLDVNHYVRILGHA